MIKKKHYTNKQKRLENNKIEKIKIITKFNDIEENQNIRQFLNSMILGKNQNDVIKM